MKTNFKSISILALLAMTLVMMSCGGEKKRKDGRTGTLAYLISGLLGVSYRNLTKDFELTSFGGQY